MKHIKHFLLKILEAVSFSEALKESKGIFSNVNVFFFFFFQNKEFLQEKMLQRAPTITERSKKVL